MEDLEELAAQFLDTLTDPDWFRKVFENAEEMEAQFRVWLAGRAAA